MTTPPAKPHLVLHIGMHKTGTSSIQHRFAAAAATSGFSYLDLGRGPNHSGAMTAAFSSAPEGYYSFKRLGFDAEKVRTIGIEVRERIEAQLSEPGAAIRIISGEDITAIDQAGLEGLRDFLAGRAGSVQVIGYVRPPRSYMESAFQQRVRGGMGKLVFPSLYPMYRKRFEKFERVFGRKRVRLLPFATDKFANGDVVADFCEQLGIQAPAGPVMSLNRSFSCRAISLLYTYRKFGAGYGVGQDEIRRNKALVQALGDLEGPRLCFAGAEVNAALTKFSNDCRWVESRLGTTLDDHEPATNEAVYDERCLLKYDARQIEWLQGWANHPAPGTDMSPQTVAKVLGEAIPAMLEQFRAAKRAKAISSVSGAACAAAYPTADAVNAHEESR